MQNWSHSTSSFQPGIRYAAGLWIVLAVTIVSAVSAEPPPTATPVKSIVTRPGFQVELRRSAGPDEGSWISMSFDDQDRLVIGRDSIYACATNGNGFYRLRDTTGDDRFDEVRGQKKP